MSRRDGGWWTGFRAQGSGAPSDRDVRMYPICLVSCCADPLRLATCWPVRAGRIDEAIGRLNEWTATAKGANFADYRTGGVPGTPYRSQWGYGGHHADPGAPRTGPVMALPATWSSFDSARSACSRRKSPSARREAGRSLNRALQHYALRSRPTLGAGDEIRLAKCVWRISGERLEVNQALAQMENPRNHFAATSRSRLGCRSLPCLVVQT